jgi:hypothetical protein
MMNAVERAASQYGREALDLIAPEKLATKPTPAGNISSTRG